MKYDLCIIGGAGHVGLPLGVAFANKRVKTVLYDTNQKWLEIINKGKFPFREKSGDQELTKALRRGSLLTAKTPKVITQSKYVLLVIGTPVDEYLNPDFNGLMRVIDKYFPYFKNGQILILRSTVYPGTSERIENYFKERGKRVSVAFCPERIVQGKALEELGKLPQIVSAFDAKTLDIVGKLFGRITPREIVLTKPVEAELAKLFSNAWRYIQFAVGNQFFMIADSHELDYRKIYEAMLCDYPRMKDLPSPGFAAGPCLLKDTLQLAAFSNHNFFLGHSAMLINEGLPNYIVQKLRKRPPEYKVFDKPIARVADLGVFNSAIDKVRRVEGLKNKTVGILGMAFKANSDDPRDSLSYKLKKIAQAEAKSVLCHDVYISDPSFHTIESLIDKSDIIILAAPHKEYKKIDPGKYPDKTFVDIWNFWGPRSK